MSQLVLPGWLVAALDYDHMVFAEEMVLRAAPFISEDRPTWCEVDGLWVVAAPPPPGWTPAPVDDRWRQAVGL